MTDTSYRCAYSLGCFGLGLLLIVAATWWIAGLPERVGPWSVPG